MNYMPTFNKSLFFETLSKAIAEWKENQSFIQNYDESTKRKDVFIAECIMFEEFLNDRMEIESNLFEHATAILRKNDLFEDTLQDVMGTGYFNHTDDLIEICNDIVWEWSR